MSGVVPEEMVQLSVPFTKAELVQLQEASGQRGVEAWARSVMLDVAGDMADAEPPAGMGARGRSGEVTTPLLAVGETALLLEEMRALRDELRRSLAEQRLWLQILYAEVRAQSSYPTPAHETAACTKAGEQLARMKQLVAEKLKS
jgi:hypothetical protein